MGRKRTSKPEPAARQESPPLLVVLGARFKRDFARQISRGKDMAKLHAIVTTLQARQPLDPRHRDHALTGDHKGLRDVHIEPDWILVYERTETELRLMRTGTHADLGF